MFAAAGSLLSFGKSCGIQADRLAVGTTGEGIVCGGDEVSEVER
jgi:hypothetical protein